ncbi:MAG: outer membrane beta-barrel protein [Bacteroidia bacterium]
MPATSSHAGAGLQRFNNYIENNRNKAVGASLVYLISDKAAFTFNTIYCDESPDTLAYPKHRLYNDAYFIYRSDNWTLAAEANFGIQGHSVLTDSTQSAIMAASSSLSVTLAGRVCMCEAKFSRTATKS